MLRHEDDIEKRIQARIAKDGIRIKEFFIDFDKLRKGTVGEAAVSYLSYLREPLKLINFRPNCSKSTPVINHTHIDYCCFTMIVPHLHWHPWSEFDRS